MFTFHLFFNISADSTFFIKDIKISANWIKLHTQVIQNESHEIVRDAYEIAEVWNDIA